MPGATSPIIGFGKDTFMTLSGKIFLSLSVVFLVCGSGGYAQEIEEYGRIIRISDTDITAVFEEKKVGLGEEVDILRIRDIVDPVSGEVRGSTRRTVARGFVNDVGMQKVQITISELISDNVQKTDVVHATGKGKPIIRKPKLANIQELTADQEIIIDIGTEEEVNEGDSFLITRMTPIYDPVTNEITGSSQVDVGTGTVERVENNRSIGTVVQLLPGMELSRDDKVVFNADGTDIPHADGVYSEGIDVSEADELKREIRGLRNEVDMLRATLDSLGIEHDIHRNEFDRVKGIIDEVVPILKRSDLKSARLVLKNDEPAYPGIGGDMLQEYRNALEDCLAFRSDEALEGFYSFMNNYPMSMLRENCRYWIAQIFYDRGEYDRAVEGFTQVLDDTRFSHKDDDASIMLGLTFMRLGKRDEALSEFERFLGAYPGSEYTGTVRSFIRQLS